ncbi:ABC-type transport auxiliary lipoprotein family protein [Candidatus Uabimicrobium amorphum]|uniref:ABC-type transport auxiliary lipoprotein component domain-containing protein n=1 Tax=Uabimicrobium amorphum TaxID=2596890 RepID=A0A5S9F7P6_UABAM|nr:ABC-type transport auxiliary lipoprotein family protein [Candidatus Uabimicrobium amorphum]BBM87874.1 hypothetical protein UABAM_06289 [Candidatus Uabimicrobium amorphum]
MRGILVLITVALVTGCVDVKQPYVEKQFFLIQVPSAEKASQTIPGSVLRVVDFDVSPAFTDKELVYLQQDNQYTSDFYNSFFISVSNMFTEASKNWLQQSAMFSQVVSLNSLIDANYILEGLVQGVYGDFRDQNAPKAVLKLQFLLLSVNENGENEVILQQNFHEEVSIADTSAAELVKGWNSALEKVLQDLEGKISAEILEK